MHVYCKQEAAKSGKEGLDPFAYKKDDS